MGSEQSSDAFRWVLEAPVDFRGRLCGRSGLDMPSFYAALLVQ